MSDSLILDDDHLTQGDTTVVDPRQVNKTINGAHDLIARILLGQKVLYVVGGLAIIFGLIIAFTEQLEVGIGSAVEGALYVVFGTLVVKYPRACLVAGTTLYFASSILAIPMAGITGIAFRVGILIVLGRAVAAAYSLLKVRANLARQGVTTARMEPLHKLERMQLYKLS